MKVQKIVKKLVDHGATCYIVGGAVRDEILGLNPKDIDIEIHNLDATIVENILSTFGKVKEVGVSFGVFKLKIGEEDLDFSLPRTDSKVGPGHRGFDIKVNPFLGITEALRRRDFTINAIAKNAMTGEIVDPFHGVEDLKNRILKIVDENTFEDDPLRVLRASQFVARFRLKVDKKTMKFMRKMV